MSQAEMHDYLLSFDDAWLDYPFGEGTAVYKFGHDNDGKGKMFALIEDGSKPLRISLKCDTQLAETLRAEYETVLPGYHLNKRHWITVICSGQLDDEQVKDLVRHSYILVSQ